MTLLQHHSSVQVNMLDADMLVQINDSYKESVTNLENEKLPFGGKDIIVKGDLLQIPPVSGSVDPAR